MRSEASKRAGDLRAVAAVIRWLGVLGMLGVLAVGATTSTTVVQLLFVGASCLGLLLSTWWLAAMAVGVATLLDRPPPPPD